MQPSVAELVERAARLFLGVVHRAEPEEAFRVDEAVIEAVVGRVRLDHVQQREIAGLRVEAMQAGLEAGDHPAVARRREEPDARRRGPRALFAARRMIAMDRRALDVDEPQRLLGGGPQRTFTEHRADRPYALDFRHDARVSGIPHPPSSCARCTSRRRRRPGTAPSP